MKKRRRSAAIGIQDSTPAVTRSVLLVVFSLLFFLIICFSNIATIKTTAMVLMVLALLGGLLCFPTLRGRVKLPLILLVLLVLMNGISTSYALSGKFALNEFLKLVVALSSALILLLIFPGEGIGPGRRIATILEGSTALAALVSVDLISTRIFSTPIVSLMGKYSADFANLTVLVPNVRLTSIFENSNVFGACGGIAVLLSLGLALSSQNRKERCAHLCCLYVTAVAFIAVFSMGSIASIAVAFLIYLLIEHKEKRGELLFLMIETLILVMVSIVIISATSFTEWDGFNAIPLLCLIAGAALLCLADRFVGQKLGEKLRNRGKLLVIVIVALLIAAILFVVIACSWTGPATLAEGESLYRGVYLEPGEYTLTADGDNGIQVTIRTQNHYDDGTFGRPIIYSGSLCDAAFTIPENSLVVYFDFAATEPVNLNHVEYISEDHSGAVPLDYKLLPDFIARRIQGIWASQTLLERIGLFKNGLDLFKLSPVIGLGIGSFETAVFSVQSAFLETKYVHNHYIQSLLETGIIGCILFVGLLAVCAVCVLISRFGKKKEFHPLTPALGAALVFMSIHAFVEVDFSAYPFLPLAFGVFALINLCCGDAIPARWLAKRVQMWILIVVAVLMIFFAILLGNNMTANRISRTNLTFAGLEQAIKLDKFEWADYKLSYVLSSIRGDVPEEIEQKAAEYADDLSKLSSNIIPLNLTEYYLFHGNVERAMEMADKYTTYVSASQEAWNDLFHLLSDYETDSEEFYAGVQHLSAKLEQRNEENLSIIRLDDEAKSFLARVLAK